MKVNEGMSAKKLLFEHQIHKYQNAPADTGDIPH